MVPFPQPIQDSAWCDSALGGLRGAGDFISDTSGPHYQCDHDYAVL